MRKIILLTSLAVSINLTAQLPNYVPANGLVGFWPFNGNANDQSGNGNNGTNTGATLTTDRFTTSNAAYYFNGSATILTAIPATFAPSASNYYSFSFWFKVNTNATSKMIISYKGGQNTTNTSNYDVLSSHSSCNPNTIAVQNYPFNNPGACSPSTINTGAWTHLYVLFNQVADSFKVYKNSQFWFAGLIGNSPPLSGYLTFGNNSTGGFGFDGSIDDVGIWNRALNPCEIRQLYNDTLSTVNVSSSSASVCAGQSTTLSASGASSYTWVGLSMLSNSVVVSPTVATSYSVISDCGFTNTITVYINPSPDVSVSTNVDVLCFGQVATLTATGAVSYVWNTGANGSNIFVSPAGNTSFTVTGLGANGCSASAIITQSVALCTGIRHTPIAEQRIVISPNPTNGFLSITGVEGYALIEIYDAIGNLISKKVSNQNTDLDLSAKAPGAYFICVRFDGFSIIKKIIKE